VDVFDDDLKQLIWRSQATDALSGEPDTKDKRLERPVDDMCKRFPPKERSSRLPSHRDSDLFQLSLRHFRRSVAH
jgi:hypothetical protein